MKIIFLILLPVTLFLSSCSKDCSSCKYMDFSSDRQIQQLGDPSV